MRPNSHNTSKPHVRRGDSVRILSGNYKHQEGVVLKVLPKAYRAIVEGINLVTRHKKPSAQQPQGGVERKEAPIHLSNLMVVDPATKEATRIGRKTNEHGRLQRYSKKTGNFI